MVKSIHRVLAKFPSRYS